ncbi:heme biosynthesis protein HemY [Roseibium alexandrii]|uniref:Putative membrane-bound protein n=1 Tax=Roseibium alexandrii (strain DSM 17067 / NCIMB 14079 / DFL-11) TaxID=244592 RepID=A0A5E8H4M0_ROSAD|nr:heme biosynthesis HemY N-terminal domain-containing protein [Roseibium alexandrii]EEE47085.2 putative membrane-bound protein [Roseibium alexandrii DFL-11]
MIRVLIFFAMLFLAALGFAWMADLPGTISVSWNGYVWEQPPVVVALVVGLVLVAFLVVIGVIRAILKSPQIAGRFFKQRRKDKGYTALSQGLIALGTGNAKMARRYGLDADKLLNEEPATKLLLAQTAQLAGKDGEARQRFEAMLDDPNTKTLGLHGLFVEAERQREPVAARHYAEEAVKAAPGLEWAGKAVLGYQAVAHHWDEALKTLERNYTSKLLDKKAYRRQRAVILTALAHKLEDNDPDRAFSLAKEAHGLALELVPAAVITSRLATRRGDIRKASKVIEATWRLSPHPELAETYSHVRTGDSAVDRLKRAKSLAAQRANTAEGAIAIAKAALEAREFEEARTQLKKVLQSEPTRAAFILMAEVEETETGDKGRVRDWLARAVKASLDKAWIADGVVSSEWQAVSPVTGKLDAFQWSSPGSLNEEDGVLLEDSLFEAPVLPASTLAKDPAAEPVEPVVTAASQSKDASDEKPEEAADAKVVELKAEPQSEEPSKTPEETETPPKTQPDKKAAAAPVKKEGYEGTTDDVKFAPPLKDLPDGPAASTPSDKASAAATPEKDAGAGKAKTDEPEKAASDATPDKQAAEPAAAVNGTSEDGKSDEKKAKDEDLDRPIEFPLSRMPDDPGTDDDEDADDKKKGSRPRFFN